MESGISLLSAVGILLAVGRTLDQIVSDEFKTLTLLALNPTLAHFRSASDGKSNNKLFSSRRENSILNFVLHTLSKSFGKPFSVRFVLVTLIVSVLFYAANVLGLLFSDLRPVLWIYELYMNPFGHYSLALLTLLFGSFVLDLLSFAQTMFFVRLMAENRGFIKFLMIAYSDLALSAFIFILIFLPIISISFLIYDHFNRIETNIAMELHEQDKP